MGRLQRDRTQEGLGPHTGRDPNVKKPEWLKAESATGVWTIILCSTLASTVMTYLMVEVVTSLSQCRQSLSVLKHAKLSKEGMIAKSSIMLGLGETDEEVKEAMADLRAIAVDILTLGQYLQPTPLHLTVKEYVTPEKFAFWKDCSEISRFPLCCFHGPLVRSSYRAGELFVQTMVRERAAPNVKR
ncbi:hypothetical protein Syun_010792 [Stephania yunnanensis]|uniref:Lipoyl synthase n=1 Tax=Stephania yunnanensis TaxID=152371 RepID=A0AAP0PPZ0_9MAGN